MNANRDRPAATVVPAIILFCSILFATWTGTCKGSRSCADVSARGRPRAAVSVRDNEVLQADVGPLVCMADGLGGLGLQFGSSRQPMRSADRPQPGDPLLLPLGPSIRSPSWTTRGGQLRAYYGISVSSAGDVNNDGYSDVIVGAYFYDGAQTNEGGAFVYHGGPEGLSSSYDWSAEGDQIQAYFGRSVSCAGDVNNDGYSDVIVGAFLFGHDEDDEGCAYVYHGGPDGLSLEPAWTFESNQEGAYLGYCVSGAGDVNDDGYSDVIVGAYRYANPDDQEGRAFVFHGGPSGLSPVPDWTAEGDQANAWFGESVAGAGDVNSDGYSDVIVGASKWNAAGARGGRALVFLGGPSGLSSTAAWTGHINQYDAYFGRSVAGAGDVNGDGYADVIVGSPGYRGDYEDQGAAFVYLGSPSGISEEPAWTIQGDLPECEFGYSVAGAGDVNGDGYSEVVVGARHYGKTGDREGRAFCYDGADSGLRPIPAWIADLGKPSAQFGTSIATAGDVNDDGYSDIIVGAPFYGQVLLDEGGAFVYHGMTDPPPELTCMADEELTCVNRTVELRVQSVPSDPVTYSWSPEPLGGQGTPVATYDTPGTKAVDVENLGTGATSSCAAVVTENTEPPELVCHGDQLTCSHLTASATATSDPSEGVDYLWTPEPASGQGTPHAKYKSPGIKKVVVTRVDTGCSDSCEVVISSDTAAPVLSCQGDVLTADSLKASATVESDPSDGVSYLWCPPPVSGQGTSHARYNRPGRKKVLVTVLATGCQSSCETVIETDYRNALLQNSPNPFTSSTRIGFGVERAGWVRLKVFDARGNLIRVLVDEEREARSYVEVWDGTNDDGRRVPAGTYFYRLQVPGWTEARKMTLAR